MRIPVTYCEAVYKAFDTMEKACEYMSRKEFSDPKEIVKDTALDTHYTENEQQHSVLRRSPME